MHETTTIRRATAADAARLATFAEAIFRETFGAQNTPADMEAYVAQAFGPELQRAEIVDPAGIVLLVDRAGAPASEPPLGYAHLVAGAAPDCVPGAAPCELKRFYIASSAHGRGLAQALMTATLAAARDLGARTLWLGVWEHNARAVGFYAKYAFARVGEHRFMLGTDVQTDWILSRGLAAAD